MKAKLTDAIPGATLWLKDHGNWKAVTVTEVSKGSKGHKVAWADTQGHTGKSSLDALYAQPKGESPSPGPHPKIDTPPL